jgi:hypothetical protein
MNGRVPELHKAENSGDFTMHTPVKNIDIYFDKYEAYNMFSVEFIKVNVICILCTKSSSLLKYVYTEGSLGIFR